ncbi:hypothetical protein DFO48_102724 [Comamonas sp. AG1104]|nr:hypothetical protein DFO48_102724 [Comamonas sp. AG1104]
MSMQILVFLVLVTVFVMVLLEPRVMLPVLFFGFVLVGLWFLAGVIV